jgi:beta-N-acetylhexosaminidase
MTTKLGLEVLLDAQLDLVAGKRVGLVACPSSVDRQLRSSVELLHAHPDVNLVALFGPEHGIRGDAQAGAKVDSAIDPLTQLPVHSLYGQSQRPSPDMLRDLDAIIIDLQDGGVRFYTFVATALYVMEAAREAGISVIVLDRPAPINGDRVEGPVLDPAYSSFVGPAPLPIRYGLTVGELALLCNERDDIHCDLTVIPLQNWSRAMWVDDTGLPFVPSSPNLPTLDAMTLYPGTCLIEGTNLSEGRGTTRPFEYIGAPWIEAESLAAQLKALDLAGVRFRPVYFVPTFSKHQGQLCAGVHIYVTDREQFQPVAAMLRVLQTLKRSYPDRFGWRKAWVPGRQRPIDLLWGSDRLRRQIDADRPVDDLVAEWQPGLQEFERLRGDYMLY